MPEVELSAGTLVGNDSGLFQLAAAQHPERIARLVITSCEAFQNFPPGLPGRAVALAGRLPGGLNALVQPLRLGALRRLPLALGWMAKRPIPREVSDAWLAPLLGLRAIRRDLAKYLRAAAKDPGVMLAAAEGLRGFDCPALVVWAAEDRVMPPGHGRRPSSSPKGGWWNSPTATPSSPKTNPPSWLAPSASSSIRGPSPAPELRVQTGGVR